MDQIAGYLDAVTEQALIGWIANCGHPGRLEPVTCVGAGGFRQTVHPFIPRADVCVALQATGRFGFAIPRSVLRGIGPTITLLDRNGNALEGGREIALPPVSPPKRVSRPACVVLHIQKTAGTSLRTALAQAGGPGEVVFAYPDGFIGLTDDELGGVADRPARGVADGDGAYLFRPPHDPARPDPTMRPCCAAPRPGSAPTTCITWAATRGRRSAVRQSTSPASSPTGCARSSTT